MAIVAKQRLGDISEKEASMNVLRLMGASVIVCVLAVGIRAEESKDNPKLVVVNGR